MNNPDPLEYRGSVNFSNSKEIEKLDDPNVESNFKLHETVGIIGKGYGYIRKIAKGVFSENLYLIDKKWYHENEIGHIVSKEQPAIVQESIDNNSNDSNIKSPKKVKGKLRKPKFKEGHIVLYTQLGKFCEVLRSAPVCGTHVYELSLNGIKICAYERWLRPVSHSENKKEPLFLIGDEVIIPRSSIEKVAIVTDINAYCNDILYYQVKDNIGFANYPEYMLIRNSRIEKQKAVESAKFKVGEMVNITGKIGKIIDILTLDDHEEYDVSFEDGCTGRYDEWFIKSIEKQESIKPKNKKMSSIRSIKGLYEKLHFNKSINGAEQKAINLFDKIVFSSVNNWETTNMIDLLNIAEKEALQYYRKIKPDEKAR